VQGGGFHVVVLVPTLAARDDQTIRLEHGEVLGSRLTSGAEPVLVRQCDTELEQGLAALFLPVIQNDAPRRVCQSRHRL
jgi:hypothetical protein